MASTKPPPPKIKILGVGVDRADANLYDYKGNKVAEVVFKFGDLPHSYSDTNKPADIWNALKGVGILLGDEYELGRIRR